MLRVFVNEPLYKQWLRIPIITTRSTYLHRSLFLRLFLLRCLLLPFGRGPIQQVNHRCTVVSRTQLNNSLASNCDLLELSNKMFDVHMVSFANVLWLQPLHNNFVSFPRHFELCTTRLTPFVTRRHIWLGVKHARVISDTYVCINVHVLPACQTHLSGF